MCYYSWRVKRTRREYLLRFYFTENNHRTSTPSKKPLWGVLGVEAKPDPWRSSEKWSTPKEFLLLASQVSCESSGQTAPGFLFRHSSGCSELKYEPSLKPVHCCLLSLGWDVELKTRNALRIFQLQKTFIECPKFWRTPDLRKELHSWESASMGLTMPDLPSCQFLLMKSPRPFHFYPGAQHCHKLSFWIPRARMQGLAATSHITDIMSGRPVNQTQSPGQATLRNWLSDPTS